MRLLQGPLKHPKRVDWAQEKWFTWPVAPAYVVEVRCSSWVVPLGRLQHAHTILIHRPVAQRACPLHHPHIVHPGVCNKPLWYGLRVILAWWRVDSQGGVCCGPVPPKHNVVSTRPVAKVKHLGVATIHASSRLVPEPEAYGEPVWQAAQVQRVQGKVLLLVAAEPRASSSLQRSGKASAMIGLSLGLMPFTTSSPNSLQHWPKLCHWWFQRTSPAPRHRSSSRSPTWACKRACAEFPAKRSSSTQAKAWNRKLIHSEKGLQPSKFLNCIQARTQA